MNPTDGVIYLTKCTLNGLTPDHDLIASVDLDALYTTSQKHMLTAIVGMALRDAGVEEKNFKHAIAASQRKTVVLDHERLMVCNSLNDAGIWHMPLKGSVLKDWYPQFGMRESSDCDILFDSSRSSDVKSIMEWLGYSCESYGGGHHDVYHKKPLTNMQMHVELFGPGYPDNLNRYYGNVKDRLVQKRGFEYAFTPEDFYIYVIAHEWEHYEKAGTGLRSILDTYVMLKKLTLDWEYIAAETEKLGIRAFEEKNRSLATHLFGEGDLTEEDREMLQYVVESGTYGTIQNSVNNKVEKYGGGLIGRIRYIVGRIFLPMDTVKRSFPVFYKYKILLPFLPAYRLIKGLRTGRRRISTEIRTLAE